ncbi:MAG TPA: hypothetical protein VHY58_12525 [Streptosporangiaceae bacterium]|nr:hypothetical protein [Streptosporangiaceae bacterium]
MPIRDDWSREHHACPHRLVRVLLGRPGASCTALDGQHFARYLRAYRRQVISRDAMIAACLAVPQISYGQVVPDAAVPDSTSPAPAGRQDEPAVKHRTS